MATRRQSIGPYTDSWIAAVIPKMMPLPLQDWIARNRPIQYNVFAFTVSHPFLLACYSAPSPRFRVSSTLCACMSFQLTGGIVRLYAMVKLHRETTAWRFAKVSHPIRWFIGGGKD
jgi:hypothetical protein